ncbi:ATP-binding cassette subfamily C protein CydD [Salsuginibacillus halophilus]|uniref:ATP-binding cassette subfamily C protein CydD n=1 Tax=Salsuginibacillus halophilus TaxID=517424 RepID=A0A2P8HW69_9BACI|nr:thiol reductant ABC exporter subunit CydD [Salsuginibacillus halophilus]PSL50428.1 ATP-binding cassette subfamily C protein CydD [Salsuginibacillus halophilus]
MKFLKETARQFRSIQLLLGLNTIVYAAAIVLQAYTVVRLVHDIFLQQVSFQAVQPFLILLAFALLVRIGSQYVKGSLGSLMAKQAKNSLRSEMLEKVRQTPLFYRQETGSRLSTLLDAVDETGPFFHRYYPQMIETTGTALLILIVVFSQNVISGLILLITAPFIPFAMAVIGSRTEKKSKELVSELQQFSNTFYDKVQGLLTLKLFQRAERETENVGRASENFRDRTMQVLKVAFMNSFMLELISMIGIGLVAIEVGLRLALFDQLTFFTAFFVLVLAPEFYTQFRQLGSAFHSGKGSAGAAEVIEDQLVQPDESAKRYESKSVPDQAPSLTFQSMHAAYPSADTAVLKDISLHVDAEKSVAVVGPSGSGKSTLLRAAAGILKPSAGDVLYNGVQLNEIEESERLNQTAFVTQDPHIFRASVKDNICMGAENNVSDADFQAVLDQVRLTAWVERLPQKEETLLGEGERGLSGGEKQRIALARALVKKPKLVLLDEPGTGLDVVTESALKETLQKLSANATVVTVAHRMTTVQTADEVVLLEKGKTTAVGRHEQLMNECENYQQLFSTKEGR